MLNSLSPGFTSRVSVLLAPYFSGIGAPGDSSSQATVTVQEPILTPRFIQKIDRFVDASFVGHGDRFTAGLWLKIELHSWEWLTIQRNLPMHFADFRHIRCATAAARTHDCQTHGNNEQHGDLLHYISFERSENGAQHRSTKMTQPMPKGKRQPQIQTA